jgi:ABC-type glutathione transport system ATPase component
LRMAAHLADEIAVMSRGKIVEQGPAEEILRDACSAEAQRLLAAGRLPRESIAAEHER